MSGETKIESPASSSSMIHNNNHSMNNNNMNNNHSIMNNNNNQLENHTKHMAHQQRYNHQNLIPVNTNGNKQIKMNFQNMNMMNSNSNGNSNGMSSPEEESTDGKKNLIVNYLPISFSDVELAQLFCEHGELVSVRIIVDKKTKRSKGYGFVKFTEAEAASNAIQSINGREISGKRLKVAYARPGGPRARANLFIGNVPKHWTNKELNELFESYGPIIESRILRTSDHESRRCGFVRLDTEASATRAIAEMDGYTPDGQYHGIHVKIAEKPDGNRDYRRNDMDQNSGGSMNHMHMGGGRAGEHDMYRSGGPPMHGGGQHFNHHQHHNSLAHAPPPPHQQHHQYGGGLHHNPPPPSGGGYGQISPYGSPYDPYMNDPRLSGPHPPRRLNGSGPSDSNPHFNANRMNDKRMKQDPTKNGPAYVLKAQNSKRSLQELGKTMSLPQFDDDMTSFYAEKFEQNEFGGNTRSVKKNKRNPPSLRSNAPPPGLLNIGSSDSATNSNLVQMSYVSPSSANNVFINTPNHTVVSPNPTQFVAAPPNLNTHQQTNFGAPMVPQQQQQSEQVQKPVPKPAANTITAIKSEPAPMKKKPHLLKSMKRPLKSNKKSFKRFAKTESERELESLGIPTDDLPPTLPPLKEENSSEYRVSITELRKLDNFSESDMDLPDSDNFGKINVVLSPNELEDNNHNSNHNHNNNNTSVQQHPIQQQKSATATPPSLNTSLIKNHSFTQMTASQGSPTEMINGLSNLVIRDQNQDSLPKVTVTTPNMPHPDSPPCFNDSSFRGVSTFNQQLFDGMMAPQQQFFQMKNTPPSVMMEHLAQQHMPDTTKNMAHLLDNNLNANNVGPSNQPMTQFLHVSPTVQPMVLSATPPPMHLTPSPIPSSSPIPGALMGAEGLQQYINSYSSPMSLQTGGSTNLNQIPVPSPQQMMNPSPQGYGLDSSYMNDNYRGHLVAAEAGREGEDYPPNSSMNYNEPMMMNNQDYMQSSYTGSQFDETPPPGAEEWKAESPPPKSNVVLPVPAPLEDHQKNGTHVCLFIYNIPGFFDESHLYGLFAKYGPVKYATVHRHKDGTSKGFGFINYYTSESARRAIKSLNGETFYNKKLQVRHKD